MTRIIFVLFLLVVLVVLVHWSSLYISVEYPEWADTIKIPMEKPWEKINKPQPIRVLQGDPIYAKSIRSVMWIVTDEGQASGVLIGEESRLAVTNEHVTKGNVWVDVFFPVRDRNDKLIGKRSFYVDRKNRELLYQLGYYTRGRVVAEDSQYDLAIVELDAIPETSRAIDHNFDYHVYQYMNKDESVIILGNPGGRDLWRWKSGRFQSDLGTRLHIMADTFGGNSGGPVLNNQGLLIGIHSSSDKLMNAYAIPAEFVKALRDTLKHRHIFSIKNDTTISELPYYFKWTASEDWKLRYAKQGIPRNHWLTGKSVQQGYPLVRFDEIVGDKEYTERIHSLETYTRRIGTGVDPYSKADAREYNFDYDSNSKKITLYLSPQ